MDCEITLKEGEKIWQRNLIDMPLEQQKVLKQYLNTQLERGFIQSSTPPSLSRPVCHGQSISHEERTSYDWYRTLINSKIIPDEYSLPLTRDIINRHYSDLMKPLSNLTQKGAEFT
jgi:hypothetical protein